MMIQSAPAGEPCFICSMAEHNDLRGAFALASDPDPDDLAGTPWRAPAAEQAFVLTAA